MNRSFYAFGVLLAALGGGMCAVSGTSRTASTLSVATQRSAPSKPAVMYCGYVMVLPAEAEPQATYEDTCGRDRCTGETYPALESPPTPVTVKFVNRETEMAGRTLYDLAYDAALFPADVALAPVANEPDHRAAWFSAAELELREQLDFFRSIINATAKSAARYPYYDEQAAAEYSRAACI